MELAEVAITQGPDQVFDYEVPAAFCDADQPERLLQVGRRVRVPFGRGGREAIGYCVAIENKQVAATRKLKPIAAVLDGQSLLRGQPELALRRRRERRAPKRRTSGHVVLGGQPRL